jgi:hypothetical protein
VKRSVISLVLVGLLAGCGTDGSDRRTADDVATASAAGEIKLACGGTERGSKRAFRSFLRILRSGDEARILSVLTKSPRFEWISVIRPNGDPIVNVRNDRREAAATVAERGGLPLRVRRFTNAEKPRRTTDFGFTAGWHGARGAIGKAALDCEAGTARVMSVALRRR